MSAFEQLIEAAPDAMVVTTRDGVIVLINAQTERLFGYTRDELVGQRIEALVPEPRRAAHAEHRRRYTHGPSLRPMGAGLELSGRRKDGGEFAVEISLSPLETDEGTRVVATVRDVSARKQAEAAARAEDARRAEALRRASAAKSEFLSAMSHELRTPLNAILGFASLLKRDRKTPLTDRQREMVDHILKGGGHLLHLVDEVLDLSKIESGRLPLSLEPVDVSDVLSEVVNTLHPMASRAGVELRRPPSGEVLPAVLADRTRTAQVLMNFGSNAIKYGRAGGQAVFTAARVEGDRVRFTVRDDGIGIPEDKHRCIFQPFQRAGQEAGPIEGTGIGLALSQRLATLMGGSVGFRSEAGVGSEFWLDLRARERPLEERSAASRSEPASSLSGDEGARYEVVYVEDNPANVAFLRELLAELDRVTLHVAPNAEIGVELVRSRLPHVVIMDINLPGMSGYDAVRLLKSYDETRDIPVIALSAAAMHHDTRRAEAAGFYRYVTKPVNVGELIALLEALLVPGAST